MIGRATLMNALSPTGTKVAASTLERSADIGDYGPQTNAYLTLILRMPRAATLRCGTTALTMHLTEQTGTLLAHSQLHLHTRKTCPTSMTPVPMPVR